MHLMAGFDYGAHGLIRTARPAIPGGPQTIVELIDQSVARHPDQEAVVGRYARYTYAQLDEVTNRAAHALIELGVCPGDRVAGCLPNQCDIIVAFLACLRMGVLWLGVNRPLAAPEKAYMLRDSQASVLLAEPEAVAQLGGLRDEVPSVRAVVTVDAADAACEWAQLVASARSDPVHATIDPFAPAAIAYTSGTTGYPKGAVHSQHNLLMPGITARLQGRLGTGSRTGVMLPFTVLNLLVLGPVLSFLVDGTCIAMDRIDAPGMAAWVRDERITSMSTVPALMYDLLTHPDVKDDDLATLADPGVGGADCPEAFRELYRKRFGKEIRLGYGLTEAPTAVTYSSTEVPLANSCGPALPHVRIEIHDDDDHEVAVGTDGEICVGPARDGPLAGVYTTMLGYWNRPDETRRALRGGLLHTGDIGFMDADGNVYVKDRRNDLIIRGGSNVYPAEVERVLHDDPRVQACAVVGKSDLRLGERVVGFVQPFPGQTVTADELRELCLTQLARYKVPEEFIFVDDFDRTAIGKIKKTALRDRLAETT